MMLPLQRTLRIPIIVTLFAYVLYVPSTHALSPDEEKVVKLQTEAERGSVLSELELAGHYLDGNGVDQNATLAAHWYEKAARQGNPDAENEIGYFYQIGLG